VRRPSLLCGTNVTYPSTYLHDIDVDLDDNMAKKNEKLMGDRAQVITCTSNHPMHIEEEIQIVKLFLFTGPGSRTHRDQWPF
jgi:hypothetical protein